MRKDIPKISIIIPVYNTEQFLTQCIGSIVGQSFFLSVEILLIDNNSTDCSPEICLDYAKRYENIRFFRQSKKGVSATRNLGLSRALGKYIMFVDSDDYIVDGALEKLFQLAERKNADVIYFNLYLHFAAGNDKVRKLGMEYKTSENIEFSKKSLYASLFRRDGYQGYACNKMYRRSVIQGVLFKEGISFMEDFIYNLDIIPLVSRVFYFSEPLYVYRQRANSLVHLKSSDQRRAYFEALKIIEAKLPKEFSSVSVLMEKDALLGWSSQLIRQDLITVKRYHRLFRSLPKTSKEIEKMMFSGPKGLAICISQKSFWMAVGLFIAGKVKSKIKHSLF